MSNPYCYKNIIVVPRITDKNIENFLISKNLWFHTTEIKPNNGDKIILFTGSDLFPNNNDSFVPINKDFESLLEKSIIENIGIIKLHLLETTSIYISEMSFNIGCPVQILTNLSVFREYLLKTILVIDQTCSNCYNVYWEKSLGESYANILKSSNLYSNDTTHSYIIDKSNFSIAEKFVKIFTNPKFATESTTPTFGTSTNTTTSKPTFGTSTNTFIPTFGTSTNNTNGVNTLNSQPKFNQEKFEQGTFGTTLPNFGQGTTSNNFGQGTFGTTSNNFGQKKNNFGQKSIF